MKTDSILKMRKLFISKRENKNHVIDLIFDAKSLYELFYTLFETELDVLKNYLLKNMILNCVREFINRANVSIVFDFKKTIIFDFVSIIKS